MIKYFGWGLLYVGAFCGQAMAVPNAALDCTNIVSALERLACFDEAAGTPLRATPVIARPAEQALSPVITLLQANERQRQAKDIGFVMSIDTEYPGMPQQRVMISAPAMGPHESRPYLAISCQSNISRLQFLMGQPLRRNRAKVELLVDGQSVAMKRQWQVLENGWVIDAGRGLPAVDLIKRLGSGTRIDVRSDEPQLDGLAFNAEGLAPLIEEERKACHW